MLGFKRSDKSIPDIYKSNLIAIDIGLFSAKFAVFEKERLGLYEFPFYQSPKDISTEDQHDLVSFQVDAIKKTKKLINSKSRIILAPQPSPHVLTRLLHLDGQSDPVEMMDKELPYEPDKYAYDIQEIKDPHSKINPFKKDKKSSKNIMAAAELDYVHRSIGLLGDFQRQVKHFVPGAVGLLNYVMVSEGVATEAPFVLLDLGAFYSHIIVFHGMDKFLVRTFELGGNHFNLEMVKKLNMDFETSERIKLERGLSDGRHAPGSETTMASSAMFRAVDGLLIQLVGEIKSTMTYFEDYFIDDVSKSKILLSGGSSKIRYLDRYISDEIGLPVKHVTDCPFQLAENQSFSSQFTTTVGLLCSPSRSGLIDLNLINNIDGLLFKLPEGEFYLTYEGFVDKRRYRKKRRKKRGTSTDQTKRSSTSVVDAPLPSIVTLIKELQDKVKSFLRGEKSDMRVSFSEIDKSGVKKQFQVYFVLLGAFFILAYGGHQLFLSPTTKKINASISGYWKALDELNQYRATQTTVRKVRLKKITKTEKILWTNKLKEIAASIPKQVWISDIEIKGITEERKEHVVGRRSLILYCHVTSRHPDHLLSIANFVNNLKLQNEFFKDFKDIEFQSAERNPEERDTIDFTLTLLFKKAKFVERIVTVEKEQERGTDLIEKTMQEYAEHQKKRYKELDDTLGR